MNVLKKNMSDLIMFFSDLFCWLFFWFSVYCFPYSFVSLKGLIWMRSRWPCQICHGHLKPTHISDPEMSLRCQYICIHVYKYNTCWGCLCAIFASLCYELTHMSDISYDMSDLEMSLIWYEWPRDVIWYEWPRDDSYDMSDISWVSSHEWAHISELIWVSLSL